MSEPRYIHIRNWDRHQHYKKRRPTWIKVYVSLLDEPEYRALNGFQRGLLHGLWLLTAQRGNGRVPWDAAYLVDVLQIQSEPDERVTPESGVSRAWVGSESGVGQVRATTRKRVSRALDTLERLGWLHKGIYISVAIETASNNRLAAPAAASPEEEAETEREKPLALTREKPKKEPKPDPIWDTLETLFGKAAAKTNAHAKRNRATADLRRLEATPDTIRLAHKRWPRLFENATITDIALATHYPQLVPAGSVPAPACAECEQGGGRHLEDCSRRVDELARKRREAASKEDPRLVRQSIAELGARLAGDGDVIEFPRAEGAA